MFKFTVAEMKVIRNKVQSGNYDVVKIVREPKDINMGHLVQMDTMMDNLIESLEDPKLRQPAQAQIKSITKKLQAASIFVFPKTSN